MADWQPGKQIQEQLQFQLKGLDDVFHNTIVALERLEVFNRLKGLPTNPEVPGAEPGLTAIGTDRDCHDDNRNPPSYDSVHAELNTQCLALYFQTKFDRREERFQGVLKHFIGDLLSWYAGREGRCPPDDVEKYCLPILAALDRFVEHQKKISEIIKKYIVDLGDLSTKSHAERERAVTEGFTAFIRGQHIVSKRMEAFQQNHPQDEPVPFTAHVRGPIESGFQRLLLYYLACYPEDRAPAQRLLKSILAVHPELTDIAVSLLLDTRYARSS
jgi:hypothetical protein